MAALSSSSAAANRSRSCAPSPLHLGCQHLKQRGSSPPCEKSGLECRKSATARRSSKRIGAVSRVYFDTSYIAKFYFNEPESPRVRELVRKAGVIHSSLWALAEFHAVLHRRMREGASSPRDVRELAVRFSEHIGDGLWNLAPVTEALLRRTSALMVSAPRDLFVRSADAVHLTTAHEIGERAVWTNDRHMLAAASYFGVTGQSV